MNPHSPDVVVNERKQHWLRVEQLLDGALDLEADELSAFLDTACAGDAGLRADVESLLAADRNAPDFLDGDAADLVFEAGVETPLSLEGQRLGAYRVLNEIGRGGMSTVHLGERADGQFQQRVAIKVLLRDFASGEPGRRFHKERQILAGLEHPGIVRIQDGGIAHDGRPYLVMEYIEGERIDRHCDRHDLSIS